MTTRHIPFRQHFLPMIRDGTKTMTTRSHAYGKPGDVLMTDAGPIRLVQVTHEQLGVVAARHYKAEGCAAPAEFQNIWESIHGWWDPKRERVLHEFKYLGAPPA